MTRGEGTPVDTGPGATLSLVKMHGCGNDYVFVDTVGGPGLPRDVDLPRLAVELSDRHFGVGADGLILISRAPSGRLAMRMWNADGSEGEMCGNGIRCLAAYVFAQGYVGETRFEVETRAGVIVPEVVPAPGPERRVVKVTVDMGPPREVREGLELVVEGGPAAGVYRGTYVSMGNPHLVLIVPDASRAEVTLVGPALERHPAFPDRTNVEFVEVVSPERLRMRVWERGSGMTLASGTGASASLVAAASAGLTGRRATVVADGGELEVEWTPAGPVRVSGPAVEVFRATYSRPLPRLGRDAAGSADLAGGESACEDSRPYREGASLSVRGDRPQAEGSRRARGGRHQPGHRGPRPPHA